MSEKLYGVTSIPVWLLADEEISMNAKMVYLALLTFIDKKRQCYPSHKTLGARCARSVSSVQRGLEELRSAGVVTWRSRWKGDGITSNLYTVTLQ